MNAQVTTPSIRPVPALRTTLEAIGDRLLRILVAIGERSGPARAARKAERLFALSEAELATLGLRREDVVEHAFKHYLMR